MSGDLAAGEASPRPLDVDLRTAVTPMVLAAGHATRLRPLTEHRAKATVPFLNRPLLDYTLDWLAKAGFRSVTVNLHHAPDSILDRYGTHAFGMDVNYSHEPVLLGTAGGPRAALSSLGERILLVNGDIVSRANLGALVSHHVRSGALATLALHTGSAGANDPQVVGDRKGNLVAFPGDEAAARDEPGWVRGVFTGVHVVERRLLEALPADVPCGIVDSVYRTALSAGAPVHAIPVSGVWYEVGDPSRYIEAQLQALLRGALPLALQGHRCLHAGGYVSQHGHIENTQPQPPYLVGAGARLKHGCYVRAAVLGDRVRVAEGARLERVIAWGGSTIGPGSSLSGSIVMADVHVPAGTVADRVVFTPDGSVPFAGEAGGGSE